MNKDNLRITNVVCSGKLPFKLNYPKDYDKVIGTSKYYCQLRNENICPILSFDFPREKGLNVHKKKKSICVSIWTSGSINIVGVLSLKEAKKYYHLVWDEIKKILNKRAVEQEKKDE